MNIPIDFPSLPLAALSSLTVSFNQSDVIGKGIIYLLLGMSVIAWSVMISKWLEMKKTLRLSDDFQAAYASQEHPLDLYMARKRFQPSPLHAIYHAAAKEAAAISEDARTSSYSAPSEPAAARFKFSAIQMDIIRRSVDRTSSQQAMALERLMPILATSITAAPFLGLLGTVWGILDAFVGMSSSFGGALLSAVAPGISGALLTTVVGLLVALPSSIAYNMITIDIKKTCVHMDSFSDELMADLQYTCSSREG